MGFKEDRKIRIEYIQPKASDVKKVKETIFIACEYWRAKKITDKMKIEREDFILKCVDFNVNVRWLYLVLDHFQHDRLYKKSRFLVL